MEPEESAPSAEMPEAQERAPVEENAPAPSGFPFSFSSVASFAATGWGRLLLWQAVLAIALGGVRHVCESLQASTRSNRVKLLDRGARKWPPVFDIANKSFSAVVLTMQFFHPR